MNRTTNRPPVTDNVTTLARRHNTTREGIRETARDLGLRVSYVSSRHCWVIAEDATTVRRFNDHLGN